MSQEFVLHFERKVPTFKLQEGHFAWEITIFENFKHLVQG
jgi:hypothetical protein